MIKRRFYREEHGERDEPSSSSSSSSSDDGDNDPEAEADATEESDDNAEDAEVKENEESSSSSGYQSEDSSAEEIDNDSSGFANDDDGTESLRKVCVGSQLSGKLDAITGILKREKNGVAERESKPTNKEDFVLKFKSVYKCRICPHIICLTEETMRSHLNSKRHTRSEKLLKENRLKAMLNSDGEIENQETPAEMHARVMALAQNKVKKKNKGRQRQKKRSRKKEGDASNTDKKAKKGDASNKDKKAKVLMKTQTKKRRKIDD